MSELKKIQRIDVESSVENYEASYRELAALDEQIKEAKKNIDNAHKEQRDFLVSEMEGHAKVMEDYSKQNNSETSEMPNGVKFGFFETETYTTSDESMIETLQQFKERFPNNFSNFITSYPKFSKTKMDRLVEDGHITLEELNQIGIEKESTSKFDIKVPKKKD